MKNNSKNMYLLKNTVMLSIGNFGSKLITFFLVPLYTNILTTAEYGTLDLITIISTVIVPLITLNIQEAVMRYAMDKNSDKDKILSVAIIILLLSAFLGLLSWPVFNMISITKQYALLLIFYMLSNAVAHILLCYLRGKEKLIDYSIISIILTFLIAVLNIYFLLVLKIGIKGYIIAYIISYIVTTILCIIRGEVFKSLKCFAFDKKIAKSMIKYSTLMIPNSLMWWIMNSLDRIMVTSIVSIDANGIYAVSSKIPSILVTLTTLFNQAWMFSAVREKDSLDKDQYTNKVYSSLFTVVVTASISLMLILKPLMKVYVGAEFYTAWLYTPPLILGSIFLTMGTFLSNEYTAHKDGMGFLKSSSIGGIINLILNFILIPSFGSLGAAVATCISYIGVFVFRIFDTKKYLNLKAFDKRKIISLILIIISVGAIYIESVYSYIIILILLLFNLYITKNFWLKILSNISKKFFKKKVKA